MIGLNEYDRRLLSVVIKPSWLSNLVAITIGLGVSVGTLIAFSINNSAIHRQLVSWQQSQPVEAIYTANKTFEATEPSLVNSWSLFLVWAVIGIGVYLIAASIVRSLGRAEEMRESLEYVHARPGTLLKSTAERIGVRLVSAIMLAVLIKLFFSMVIPYSILVAHASTVDPVSFAGAAYALLSFSIVAFTLHLQVILLRLTLGRTRVFSSTM